MRCIKTCTCDKCEMLQKAELTIIKHRFMQETRQHIPAWRCRNYGTYAIKLNDLKTSDILDDFIWEED